MLLEIVISVPVPASSLQVPPAHWMEGLQNLLLEGHWQTRIDVPEPSSGAVLAHLYAAARSLDPSGALSLGRGGDEVLETLGHADPLPDLEELPKAWSEGLADGTLTFTGQSETLHYTLTGRYVTRVRRRMPALRLSLRAVAKAVLPQSRLELVDGSPEWDPGYEAALGHTFSSAQAFSDLRHHLLTEGEALVVQLEQALSPLRNGPLERLPRVLVLEDLKHLDGLLRGQGAEARRSIVALGRHFSRVQPRVAPVYRRDAEGRLSVWRGTDFVVEGGELW